MLPSGIGLTSAWSACFARRPLVNHRAGVSGRSSTGPAGLSATGADAWPFGSRASCPLSSITGSAPPGHVSLVARVCKEFGGQQISWVYSNPDPPIAQARGVKQSLNIGIQNGADGAHHLGHCIGVEIS